MYTLLGETTIGGIEAGDTRTDGKVIPGTGEGMTTGGNEAGGGDAFTEGSPEADMQLLCSAGDQAGHVRQLLPQVAAGPSSTGVRAT
jgi:hypothetical protein